MCSKLILLNPGNRSQFCRTGVKVDVTADSPVAVEPTTRTRIMCCISRDGALKIHRTSEELASGHLLLDPVH